MPEEYIYRTPKGAKVISKVPLPLEPYEQAGVGVMPKFQASSELQEKETLKDRIQSEITQFNNQIKQLTADIRTPGITDNEAQAIQRAINNLVAQKEARQNILTDVKKGYSEQQAREKAGYQLEKRASIQIARQKIDRLKKEGWVEQKGFIINPDTGAKMDISTGAVVGYVEPAKKTIQLPVGERARYTETELARLYEMGRAEKLGRPGYKPLFLTTPMPQRLPLPEPEKPQETTDLFFPSTVEPLKDTSVSWKDIDWGRTFQGGRTEIRNGKEYWRATSQDEWIEVPKGSITAQTYFEKIPYELAAKLEKKLIEAGIIGKESVLLKESPITISPTSIAKWVYFSIALSTAAAKKGKAKGKEQKAVLEKEIEKTKVEIKKTNIVSNEQAIKNLKSLDIEDKITFTKDVLRRVKDLGKKEQTKMLNELEKLLKQSMSKAELTEVVRESTGLTPTQLASIKTAEQIPSLKYIAGAGIIPTPKEEVKPKEYPQIVGGKGAVSEYAGLGIYERVETSEEQIKRLATITRQQEKQQQRFAQMGVLGLISPQLSRQVTKQKEVSRQVPAQATIFRTDVIQAQVPRLKQPQKQVPRYGFGFPAAYPSYPKYPKEEILKERGFGGLLIPFVRLPKFAKVTQPTGRGLKKPKRYTPTLGGVISGRFRKREPSENLIYSGFEERLPARKPARRKEPKPKKKKKKKFDIRSLIG